MNDPERQQVESLLFIIFEKTKYDEGFYFDRDGEEEAIFLEYRYIFCGLQFTSIYYTRSSRHRKQLRTLFENVAILDRELVLNRVRDLVNMTLPRWQTTPFTDTEAALTFLYLLGEALPASHGNHFSGDLVCLLKTLAIKRSLLIGFPLDKGFRTATDDGVTSILWSQ